MPRAATPRRTAAWRAVALPLALAATALAVYWRALPFPFVYDDVRTVVTNGSLTDLSNARAILWHDVTRPLVNLTYALDYAVWGLDPRGFRLTSVLLHAAVVVLLFAWTRRLVDDTVDARAIPLDARFAAGTTALLFAVHPVMIQAAGYISGRAEVLCAAWSLGALLLLRRFAREGGARWLTLGLGAWLAALASKEIAAMVPFVLLAWRHLAAPSDPAVRRRLRILGPLVALTVLAGIGRLAVLWTVENPGEARVFWGHALVELDVFRRYLQLLVVPVGQSAFHAIPPVESLASLRVVAAVLLVLGLGGAAWKLRRREPLVSFGLAWFALFVLPSAVLVVVDLGEPMAEQRIYLASAGVLAIVGVALARARAWCGAHRPGLLPLTAALPLVLAAALVARTEARLDVWSSPIRLWEDAALSAPGAWLPQLMLGDSLDAAGRPADAIQAYRRAAELGPDQAVAHVKLGTLLMQAGDRESAGQALERALQLDPSSATAQNALGALAMTGGQPKAARTRFEAALAADPRNVPARLLLAALEEQAGRKADARRWCEEVRALAPGTPEVESCLGRNAP